MKQHEAVIEAMKALGGYATLGQLYQAVPKVPDCKWETKTPFASIRRIVQTHTEFFKIKPGLWALTSERARVLGELELIEVGSKAKEDEFSHSYFQGLLVEIGNLKGFQTYVPNQDKNKPFLRKKLTDIRTVEEFYPFTYEPLLRRARTVDVTWFNERKLPRAFFEVEYSTNIQDSLTKFTEFQDFRINFCIVADSARFREFKSKLAYAAFSPIRDEVEFWDYERVSDVHSKLAASLAAGEFSQLLSR